jgi:DNA-binding MarR family transcriptional regulator
MKKKDEPNSVERDTRTILDATRKLVRGLRHSSLEAERRHGLSSAQLFVLSTLAESKTALSVNELAVRTLTHQSSVSVVASKLVERGFAQKRRAEADSRRVEVLITAAGKKTLGKNPEPVQTRLIDAIRELRPATRAALAHGFHALLVASGLDREEAALFFEEKND